MQRDACRYGRLGCSEKRSQPCSPNAQTAGVTLMKLPPCAMSRQLYFPGRTALHLI